MTSPIFLFSIDLEDIRLRMDKGLLYEARVEVLIDKYLDFLNVYNAKATFFTVGDIPKHYPNIIQTLVDEGHEIACHSNQHIPIANQTRQEFVDDVVMNMESLYRSGAKEIRGYRAPIFSVTPKTPWVFEELKNLGLEYSSSVLPAKNPMYGWENFGDEPKKVIDNFWEIPMILRKSSLFKVPFSGGVYFRFLPFYFIKKSFKYYFDDGVAVTSYFHPYDIDCRQERFMHPDIENNRLYNELLYFNRKDVFPRLHKIMQIFQPKIISYSDYIDQLNNSN